MDDRDEPGDELKAVLAELMLLGHTVQYYGAHLDTAEPHADGAELRRAGWRIATLTRHAAELVSALPG